jgi:hypothetical protein
LMNHSLLQEVLHWQTQGTAAVPSTTFLWSQSSPHPHPQCFAGKFVMTLGMSSMRQYWGVQQFWVIASASRFLSQAWV